MSYYEYDKPYYDEVKFYTSKEMLDHCDSFEDKVKILQAKDQLQRNFEMANKFSGSTIQYMQGCPKPRTNFIPSFQDYKRFYDLVKFGQKFMYDGKCYRLQESYSDMAFIIGPGGQRHLLTDVVKEDFWDNLDSIKVIQDKKETNKKQTTDIVENNNKGIEEEKKMEKTNVVKTALVQVASTAKDDMKDGAWRAGTNEAIEIVCSQALKVAEKHANPLVLEYIKLALESNAGKAALAMVVGNGILVSNHPNKNFQRLGKELRVYGWANTFSWAFRVLVRPIMDELMELVKGLPEDAGCEWG